MSNIKNEAILIDDLQAVLIADTFEDEFIPITNDIPLSLLPLLNKPILDYTLEFLSLGGIKETFIFCCFHVEKVKNYVRKRIEQSACWSVNMKVHVLISESCRTFGDCLRDLDAKGLVRGDFVLLEPGVISNINLQPILQRHKENVKNDRNAAITLIYQEAGIGQICRTSQDEIVLAIDSNDKIVFYDRVVESHERKIKISLETFLESSKVSVLHNIKDTHIAICSSSTLSLFTDNFDYQTRDALIKGLAKDEEVTRGTMYIHLVKGNQYGGAITNWQNYQAISAEMKDRWMYPLIPSLKQNSHLKNDVIIGENTFIPECNKISRCIIGENVSLGKNVEIQDSFIMSNVKIEDNANINLSFIGSDCCIKEGCKIHNSSIVGKGVTIQPKKELNNDLIQATKPTSCNCNDSLGSRAFKVCFEEQFCKPVGLLPLNNINKSDEECDGDEGFTDTDDEDLSFTHSPPPDDTKSFFVEVLDSLMRGYEDELKCDNLILEVNASRYAYNIAVKEVNFNVVKAILHIYLKQPTGLQRLLSYFSPIWKNYIRNESGMLDCLQAIEDVAVTNEKTQGNWILFVLKWLYSKDLLSEEKILEWGNALDANSEFALQVKPFLDWLEQAEEGSSEDD